MDERNVTRGDSAPVPPRYEGGPAGALPTQLGAYRIQGRLGQGGMGTVYLAWHTRLKRTVALKTLRAEYVDNAPAVARFHREMEAVGKLDHPNLIRATDAGEDQGIHFLAMDFVEGLDAARLSQMQGPLRIADACEVVRQAATGLQYVHEHHLVHRDVKPSNLMVTPTGRVKVLDLGLALLHAASGERGELTESNQWMGTADYMAPEQGRDAHAVDIRADVYSLGCTLYKLLVGKAPFGGSEYNTPYRKMDAHAHQPAPPLRHRRTDVPDELSALVERMMAKAPSDRFATPGEVADALAPFAAGADLARLVAGSDAPAMPQRETPAGLSAVAETGPFGPPTPASSVFREMPTRTAASTAIRPWRRGRWVAAFVLAGAALAALLTWGMRRAPQTEGPAPPAETDQELTPGTWHNLLTRSPALLFWPSTAAPPQFDAKRERLLVMCNSPALLSLGTVRPGVRYSVELGIRQPEWTGGVGLFFGYHDSPDGPVFQELTLTRNPPNRPGFHLQRSKGAVPTLRNGESYVRQHGLFHQDLDPLPSREVLLSIDVPRMGPLNLVRWDGKVLPELASNAQTNDNFTKADYHGQFGIVIGASSAEIRTARVFIYEKD